MLKKAGFAAFGQYYSIELIEDPDIYEKVFPAKLGYPEFAKRRPVEYRSGDKMPYLEINLNDEIRLRKVAKMDWTDDFIPPQ